MPLGPTAGPLPPITELTPDPGPDTTVHSVTGTVWQLEIFPCASAVHCVSWTVRQLSLEVGEVTPTASASAAPLNETTSAKAPRVTLMSPPDGIRAPVTTTTPPPAAARRPTTGSTRLSRGDTLCPRMTPMTSSRPSRSDGTSAATTVLSTAHGTRIAIAVHGMSSASPAKLVDGCVATHQRRPTQTVTTPSFDAAANRYVDLYEAGIIDPTKVVRVALENAVSVASVLLLTEAVMTELPEKEAPPPNQPHPDMY